MSCICRVLCVGGGVEREECVGERASDLLID